MNWVCATNSNFIIPISLQSDGAKTILCKDKMGLENQSL